MALSSAGQGGGGFKTGTSTPTDSPTIVTGVGAGDVLVIGIEMDPGGIDSVITDTGVHLTLADHGAVQAFASANGAELRVYWGVMLGTEALVNVNYTDQGGGVYPTARATVMRSVSGFVGTPTLDKVAKATGTSGNA